VRADPFAHGGHRSFQQTFGGELGLAGQIVERHLRFSLFRAVAPHHALSPLLLQCVFLTSSKGIDGRARSKRPGA